MKQSKHLRRAVCVVLALVMLIAAIPFASADVPQRIKSTFVDIDMQVKSRQWTHWDNGPVSLKIEEQFDFRTIMDTTNIKTAARGWYESGKANIYEKTKNLPSPQRETARQELMDRLENSELTGSFTVTITVPDNIVPIPESYTGSDMDGFNDGAKIIFYEGPAARTHVTNPDGSETITIVIHPKAPYGSSSEKLTLGELYHNLDTYLPTLTFTSAGNRILTAGRYTVIGTMNGFVDFKAEELVDAHVDFYGTQMPGAEFVNPVMPEKISATLDAEGHVVEPDHDPGEETPTRGRVGVVLNTDDHFCYIIGYPDGLVRPTQNITRDEVTTIFYRLLRVEERIKYATTSNPYTDVPADRWSNKAISTMTNGKFVEGYPNGSFRPHAPITRAEFVTMATRFANLTAATTNPFSDISGHWAYDYILKGYNAGWINGYPDGSFRPNAYITRAEVMTIINRMLERKVDAEGLLPEAHYWPDMNGNEWYYFDVMEATNAHDYFRRSGLIEKWTKIDVNFVWVEKDAMEDPN